MTPVITTFDRIAADSHAAAPWYTRRMPLLPAFGSKYRWYETACAGPPGQHCSIPCRLGKPSDDRARGGPHIWGWNGNEDKPTLLPSISCSKCKRHFHVTDGIEKSTPDGAKLASPVAQR